MKISFNLSDTLKAHEVLHEEACVRAVEEARRFEGQVKIPVTMKGILVGYADVLRDGTITVTTDESPEGRELRDRLLDDTAKCISLSPNSNDPVIRPLALEGL